MEIEGNGALVVGGASGLGEATARRLRAQGAALTIADVNVEKGEALADIAELEDHIEEMVAPFAMAVERLDEIPGLGPVAACAALFIFTPSGDGLYVLPLGAVAVVTLAASVIAAVRLRSASSSNGRPVAAADARPTIDITPASWAAPITASLAPGQANISRGS